MSRGDSPIVGLLAEYATPEAIEGAARRLMALKERPSMDYHAPYPMPELDEVLEQKGSPIPLVMGIGGLTGCIGGFWMQVYAMALDYPINVGGRPLFSWPAFVPVTFELTVLGAALAGFVGVLVAARLPKPFHPVFTAPSFRRASQDRFFLSIENPGDSGSVAALRKALDETRPLSVSDLYDV